MTDKDAIVFVVDDDSSIREAIKSLVTLSGLRVETFGTAQEFVRVGEGVDAQSCQADQTLDRLPNRRIIVDYEDDRICVFHDAPWPPLIGTVN